MRRRPKAVVLLIAAALICLGVISCGGSGHDVPPTIPPGTTTFTDHQLEQAVYCNYFLPPGFYSEGHRGEKPSYLDSASIDTTREHDPWWAALSTEDPAQARSWAEQSVKYWGYGPAMIRVGAFPTDAPPLRIVSGREDPRFFEFVVQDTNTPPSFMRLRVHRANYFVCSYPNRPRRTALVGSYRVRPVTAEGVKNLAEYLWYVQNYADDGPRVLSSVGDETTDSLTCTIYAAQLDLGRNGQDHEITLLRWTYTVSLQGGDLALRRESLRTIPGRIHNPD
jgi:hypothetical protein